MQIEYDKRRLISFQLSYHLGLDRREVLKPGIELRPLGCGLTIGKKIQRYIIGEGLFIPFVTKIGWSGPPCETT
jgi:hypothetical protein